MVLSKSGEMFAGGLVFVTIPEAQPEEPKKKGKEAPEIKVKVSSSQGGNEVERALYTGQSGLADDYEKYVFMLDKVRSRTILGESANLFGKYRADLMEISSRMEKTNEVQGRLLKSLGQIKALEK